MDRAEFLNRLEAQLLDVPQAEREEALQYYEDYLNDAGDAGDFDILQELGTPEEVADSIRNGLRQDRQPMRMRHRYCRTVNTA